MHSKPFPRYLGGAWRLLLCALLVAALGPVARVRSAPPGGGFTDLGALGLPAVEQGSLAWGDHDGDGDLDVLLGSGPATYVFRNDGGAFVDIGASLHMRRSTIYMEKPGWVASLRIGNCSPGFWRRICVFRSMRNRGTLTS